MSPLPEGRVDLNAVVSGYVDSGFAIDLESHAACLSRLRRSISSFLHVARSPAQALQDHAKQSSVCTMLNTDRCSPRHINMDGTGRPRFDLSRLRVKEPRLTIVPLSIDEVARFWSSFRTARDLAIVGMMLMHGLRSAEVIALNRDDVLLSEGQLRVRGKGNKMRFLPLAPETTQLLDHYLRLERPDP